jgi:hypothetical protein
VVVHLAGELDLSTAEELRRRLMRVAESGGTAPIVLDVIGQAKGILMERQRVSAGDAFDLLHRASQKLNHKLADVAEHLSETGDTEIIDAPRHHSSELVAQPAPPGRCNLRPGAYTDRATLPNIEERQLEGGG